MFIKILIVSIAAALLLGAVFYLKFLLDNELIFMGKKGDEVDWNDPDLVIDVHVHTFPRFVGKMVTDNISRISKETIGTAISSIHYGAPRETYAVMKQAGISAAMSMNFEIEPKRVKSVNHWTLKQNKHYEAFLGFVSFHHAQEADMVKSLEELAQKGKFYGIKLNPLLQDFHPAADIMEPLYSYCEQKQIPILFHSGKAEGFAEQENNYSEIDNFKEVLNKYPGLIIILAHMGGGDPEKIIEYGKKYKNLYFDTSIVVSGNPALATVAGFLDNDKFTGIIKAIGAEKILFGSDSPWGFPIQDVERLKSIPLSAEEKRLILGGNAVRLFRLDR